MGKGRGRIMEKRKVITYVAKKVYKQCISIRSYFVEKAILEKSDILVLHKGLEMLIPYETLKLKFQFTNKEFKSRFDDQKYSLYDFQLIPNKEQTILQGDKANAIL